MRVPHPIPYQGSKRNLASAILEYFPGDISAVIEPFAGSAAVTLAAAARDLAARFVINDRNEPLINLWRAIIDAPDRLARQYTALWEAQRDNPRLCQRGVEGAFGRP